jgi:insertion element IS1 protein InsB
VERLLLQKIPLAGIAGVLKVTERWLQTYVNIKYENVPQQVEGQPKGRLTVQMDEMCSFVDDKNNKQWAWLAIDAKTREIVGCYIGDRSAQSAQSCGILCLESIVNVQSVIPISGQLI